MSLVNIMNKYRKMMAASASPSINLSLSPHALVVGLMASDTPIQVIEWVEGDPSPVA
ncbi:hypothetical protein A2U01_0009199 [Trifolium medium]|uniref:Uncharacterized protein n=1 Tax=Trifolium medium TaxID=97028 RepID=A0A392MMJ7_9FABA|nr:hypothetical protein [Trifolium medium]